MSAVPTFISKPIKCSVQYLVVLCLQHSVFTDDIVKRLSFMTCESEAQGARRPNQDARIIPYPRDNEGSDAPAPVFGVVPIDGRWTLVHLDGEEIPEAVVLPQLPSAPSAFDGPAYVGPLEAPPTLGQLGRQVTVADVSHVFPRQATRFASDGIHPRNIVPSGGLVSASGVYYPNSVRKQALNGNNGSYTNSDDVAARKARTRRKNRAMAEAARGAIVPVARQVGMSAANAAAAALGMPGAGPVIYKLGTTIGGKVVNMIKNRIQGRGDYVVRRAKTNSLFNQAYSGTSGFGEAMCDCDLEIAASEIVATITTGNVAGAFTTMAFPINAAMKYAQYLSTAAMNYEMAEYVGIAFEFESTCGENLSGAVLGGIIGAFEANPNAPLMATATALRNGTNSVYCRLDQNFMAGMECAKGTGAANRYFIRNSTAGGGSLPVSGTSDPGFFQIGVQPAVALGANAIVGVLRFHYHVKLYGPRPSVRRDGFARISRTGATNTNPLGTTARNSVAYGALSQNGGVTVTGTTITLPAIGEGDVFIIEIGWNNGSSVAFAAPVLTGTNAATYPGVWDNQYANGYYPQTGGTCTYAALNSAWQWTGTNASSLPSIALSTGGTIPTNATVDIIIHLVLGGVGAGAL